MSVKPIFCRVGPITFDLQESKSSTSIEMYESIGSIESEDRSPSVKRLNKTNLVRHQSPSKMPNSKSSVPEIRQKKKKVSWDLS